MKKMIRSLLYRIRGDYTTDKLIKMGLVVGDNFNRLHGAIIDPAHCWLISIGDNVTLAPRVHILAHDASTKYLTGYTKIGNVIIGDNVFVGASATILPNVEIGSNVIIGAGSVVTRNLDGGGVYIGNPAKFLCSIEQYTQNNYNLMESSSCYSDDYTIRKNISNEMKNKMKSDLKGKIGFVR